MQEIQGRTTDFVVAADGTVMHGLALVYVLRDLPSIRQFKIVQESRDELRVQVVADAAFDAAAQAAVIGKLKARLGASVRVLIERVAEIAPERSGKYRYVVSRVPLHEAALSDPA